MSKKQALDILGESHIPEDLLTSTTGYNGAIDGFHEDLEYGAGVLEGVLDPDFMEPPALPTGLTKGAEGMDLTAMLGEESLTALEWLDPTQLQDPERLPESPQSIPELEEAWGVNRRTDGVNVYAKDLNRARYEESLAKQAERPKKASAKQLLGVVTHAMRRSAMGQDIDTIFREAMESVGEEMYRIAPAMRRVRAEHGLLGNVFIRASAYPGYGTGKWTKQVKRYASGARYIVVSQAEMDQATWIKNGRCAYTGKHVVTEVPWKEAFSHYRARLASERFTFDGAPREALRVAFLNPDPKRVAESNFPQHDPSLREAPKRAREKLVDPAERRSAKEAAVAHKYVRKLADNGQITAMDRDAILASDLQPHEKVKLAARAAGKVNTGEYQGTVQKQHVSTRRRSFTEQDPTESATFKWIRRAMSEGFAGKNLSDLIGHRIAQKALSHIKEPLARFRKAHEGGSGFLYVDAGAYASSSGVKGCEEGALKHRANQIPAVWAMDRCASCSLARTREDGTRKCGAYNKDLLEDTGGPDMARLRLANVKVANMSDAEQTAAMFATPENAFQPGEFGLKNSNLEDVEVEIPEHNSLDVTFGGWDL